MNIFSRYCLILVALGCCSACTYSPNFFSGKVKPSVIAVETRLLTPDTSFQAEMGTDDFAMVGGNFVYTARGRDTIFYVYNQDKYLGAFGQRGRGTDEFLNTIHCGQVYRGGDSIQGMWINDMMGQEMKLVNVVESVKRNKTVIMKKVLALEMAINSFSLNDTTMLAQQYIPNEGVNLVVYNPESHYKKNIPFYTPSGLDPFVVYQNHIRVRPDGGKIVSVMCYLNQINIFSLQDSSRIAVTTGKPEGNTLDALKLNWAGEKKTLYYAHLDVTDKYIFALYVNQFSEDFAKVPQPVIVHILDWEGNLRQSVQLPEYIEKISVDAGEECLYGFSFVGEKIYKYDLKGIL